MPTNWNNDAETIAAYTLDEGSGNYFDGSANSNDISTISNVTRGVAGKYGDSAQFTQINNARMEIPSSTSMTNINPISVCLWVYQDTDGENSVNNSDAGYFVVKNSRSWLFANKQTDKIRWLVHYGGGNAFWDTSSAVVSYSTWQHYAATHTRSPIGSTPTIYVNGVSQSLSASTSSGAIDDDTGSTTFLGISTIDGTNELDSIIDELLINEAVMTSTDVNEVMAYGIDGLQGGTVVSPGLCRVDVSTKGINFANSSTVSFYNRFKKNLMCGCVDFWGSGSHQVKCALLTSSYTFNADDNYFTGLSTLYESSGTGYTAGGNVLSNFQVVQLSGNHLAFFDCNDTSWTGVTTSFRYAVLYDNTLTTKDLIMCIDFGATQTFTAGCILLRLSNNGLINIK